MASSAEPALHVLRGSRALAAACTARTTPNASRGDALFVLPTTLTLVDVSMVHPAGFATSRKASRVVGAAAADRDTKKRDRYMSGAPDAYAFVPLSTESYGRLGQPAMDLLNDFAEIASASGAVRKTAFITIALRELSVVLCRGQGILFRASLKTLACASGVAFDAGSSALTAEVS